MTFINPFRRGPVLDAVSQSDIEAAKAAVDPLARIRAAQELRAKMSAPTSGIDEHAMRAQNGGSKSEGAAHMTLTIANFPTLTAHLNEKAREHFSANLKVLTDGSAAGQIMNMHLKDAKDYLGRVADEAWKKNISDVYANAGKYESLPKDVMAGYWDISSSTLHDWRFHAKKLSKITSQHPMVDAMRALDAEVMPLVELVDSLKDKVVKRVAKTDEQKREEAVQKAMPKTKFSQAVWDAVMERKPVLEADYKAWMKRLFESTKKELGPRWADLVNMRPGKNYGRAYTDKQNELIASLGLKEGVVEGNYNLFQKTLSRFVDTKSSSNDYYAARNGTAGYTGSLNEQKLDALSKEYADAVCLAIVGKIQEKAGELENPKVAGHLIGFEFDLTGEFKGNQVRIVQSTKLVVNAYGTAFNQWPALIYVNGKFMPEAAYKAWMVGKG